MRKILYLIASFILLIYFTSCGGVPNKSITEELSTKELSEIFKSVPEFERTYSKVERMRYQHLSNAAQKAHWYDLTYKQFHNFLIKAEDEEKIEESRVRAEVEWNKVYAKYLAKVDSISNHWKKYRDDNSLETYVKVDLTEIDKSDWSSLKFTLKLTPLRGALDKVTAYYTIVKKGEPSYFSSLIMMGHNKVEIKDGLNTPKAVAEYTRLSYNVETALRNLSVSDLFENHEFKYYIHGIVKDGKGISAYTHYENIPSSVKSMWEDVTKGNVSDFYKEWGIKKVTEEILGEAYISLDNYTREKRKEEERKIDKMAAEFYQQ